MGAPAPASHPRMRLPPLTAELGHPAFGRVPGAAGGPGPQTSSVCADKRTAPPGLSPCVTVRLEPVRPVEDLFGPLSLWRLTGAPLTHGWHRETSAMLRSGHGCASRIGTYFCEMLHRFVKDHSFINFLFRTSYLGRIVWPFIMIRAIEAPERSRE